MPNSTLNAAISEDGTSELTYVGRSATGIVSGVVETILPQISFPDPVLRTKIGNRLLQLLLPEDYALVAPHLTRVPLKLNSRFAEAGAPIEELCFPEAGVIGLPMCSLMASAWPLR